MKAFRQYIYTVLHFILKYPWRIFFGLILVTILYAVGKWGYLRSMVDVNDTSNKFLVSSVININEDRIKYKREIYVKDDLFCTFFDLDGKYSFVVFSLNKNALALQAESTSEVATNSPDNDGIIISNEGAPVKYIISIEFRDLPLIEGNNYSLSPIAQVSQVDRLSPVEWQFRSSFFAIKNESQLPIAIITGLSNSITTTINTMLYNDSDGNRYLFVLYQEEGEAFKSVKSLLEEE